MTRVTVASQTRCSIIQLHAFIFGSRTAIFFSVSAVWLKDCRSYQLYEGPVHTGRKGMRASPLLLFASRANTRTICLPCLRMVATLRCALRPVHKTAIRCSQNMNAAPSVYMSWVAARFSRALVCRVDPRFLVAGGFVFKITNSSF